MSRFEEHMHKWARALIKRREEYWPMKTSIQQSEPKAPTFKQGELVLLTDSSRILVVLVTSEQGSLLEQKCAVETFSGVVVHTSTKEYEVGRSSNMFSKYAFSLFNGVLTMEN